MSGFGIRALKKKAKNDQQQEKNQYIKYIVYGQNTYAVLCFLKLHQMFPGEVKLLCASAFLKADLLKELNCSLESVRSDVVAQELMGINPYFEITKQKDEVEFYKDAKFHRFGGRAKPHELKNEEVFFTNSFYSMNTQAAFGDENLDQLLSEHELPRIISQIEICDPQDLIEVVNVKIHTGENEVMSCEKLFFCESPKKLLSLVSNKEKLSDELHRFAAGIEESQAIGVYFKADRQIYPKVGTVVLPQSMGHDWGSFILDFSAFDSEKQTQEFKALSFIGEGDLQEDDLAKKIRLMKRVIKRVFPEFAQAKLEQTIKFNEEYSLKSLITPEEQSFYNSGPIQFLGAAAPIKHDQSEKFQYLSRALVALKQLEV